MRKLIRGVGLTGLAGVTGVAGYWGYLRKEANIIRAEKQREVGHLTAEFTSMPEEHRRRIKEVDAKLHAAEEQLALKHALWGERLKRMTEDAKQYAEYEQVIPHLLDQLGHLEQLYAEAARVMGQAAPAIADRAGQLQRLHRALLAGGSALLTPEQVCGKASLGVVLQKVQAVLPEDEFVAELVRNCDRIPGDEFGGHRDAGSVLGALSRRYAEGLAKIDRTQHSLASTEGSSMARRAISSVLCLAAPNPEGDHDGLAIRTREELHECVKSANEWLNAVRAGKPVPATGVPIQTTPEGAEALRHIDSWVKAANHYLVVDMLSSALNAHLTSLAACAVTTN